MYEPDEILRKYFLHLSNTSDPELYDLVEYVDELVKADPLTAWHLVKNLIDISPSEDALSYVAAGPLENLLVRHGSTIARVIREDALRDEHVRDALSRVLLYPISKDVQSALGEWLHPTS